jgi:hypothetical protein
VINSEESYAIVNITLGRLETTGQAEPPNPYAHLHPGRPEQEVPAEEPPSEGASWWSRHLR